VFIFFFANACLLQNELSKLAQFTSFDNSYRPDFLPADRMQAVMKKRLPDIPGKNQYFSYQ